MMSLDNKTKVLCSNNLRTDVQLHQQLAAASFGGAVSAIVTCPFDVVKTRLQIAPSAPLNPRIKHQVFSGTIDAFIKIIRNEGILTLWRGLAPSLIMTVPNAAIYFNTYEALKKRITQTSFPYPVMIPLVAGSLARVVAVATLAPLELIRTNFQAEQKHRTVLSFVRKIGLNRMWLGVGATLSRDVPFSAIYWTSYEFVKGKLKPEMPQTTTGGFITSFVAGASSGMLSAFLTTPIDLVKTRLQTGAVDPKIGTCPQPTQIKSLPKQANFYDCIEQVTTVAKKGNCECGVERPPMTATEIARLIYAEEGFKGFMRGWLPRAVKVGPACAIMISSYELIKSIGSVDCISG